MVVISPCVKTMGEAESGVAYTTKTEHGGDTVISKGRMSKSDHRWLERYKRIIQKKEDDWVYLEQKSQQKKDRQTVDLTMLVGMEKVVVVCETKSQIRLLLKSVSKQFPDKYIPQGAIDRCCMYPGIAFDLKLGSTDFIDMNWPYRYESYGYTIVNFADLIPVRDLGAFDCDTDIDILFT